jgi:antirestriction protein ArdC
MSKEQSVKQADIYDRVTKQIVEAIEAGAGRFKMPWHITSADTFSPMNAVSKRRYRGVNVISLWIAAESCGYESGMWATYKQWGEFGAQVRRGEKATLIVFWKVSEREEE